MKEIVHLHSTHDDLRVAVLKCDMGFGLVRKGLPDSQLSYSLAEIEALDHKDIAADGERLLKLKPPRCLGEFLGASAGSPPNKDDMYWGPPRHRRALIWRQKCFRFSRRSR